MTGFAGGKVDTTFVGLRKWEVFGRLLPGKAPVGHQQGGKEPGSNHTSPTKSGGTQGFTPSAKAP
jgi:hypothetical protein